MNGGDSIHKNLDLAGARERLVEKLEEGENVGGLWLKDLLDSGLSCDHYQYIVEDVAALLTCTDEDGRTRVAKRLRDRLIKRYLDSKPELVQEEAEAEAASAEEEEA